MATHGCVGVVCVGSAQFSKRDRKHVGKVKITGSSPNSDLGFLCLTLLFKGLQGPGAEEMGIWSLVFS